MKSIKVYLLVVSSLLVIAIGFGVYVWYTVQALDRSIKEVESTSTAPAPDTEVNTKSNPEVDKDS